MHVSLTKVYDGQNMLVNQFSSKQEVIEVTILLLVNNIISVITIISITITILNQVVLASCFIPVFTGWVPPRYRGTRVIGQ